MGKLQNIVFDLGGVLLDLDFDAPVKAFKNHGSKINNPSLIHLLKDGLFIEFETGRISPALFRDRLRQHLHNQELSDNEIDAAWCSLLKSIPAHKVEILRNLSKQYKLFLYSNTNAIHISWFEKRFLNEHGIEWTSLFEKVFYSHEINDRKPTHTGFRHIATMAGIEPEESLFIDDMEINVEAAAQTGFRTLHYIPGTDLGKAIEKVTD